MLAVGRSRSSDTEWQCGGGLGWDPGGETIWRVFLSVCLSLSFGWLLCYSAQNADICFDGDAPSADTASSASVAAHLLLLVTLLGVGIIPQPPPPPTAGIKVVEPSLLHLAQSHSRVTVTVTWRRGLRPPWPPRRPPPSTSLLRRRSRPRSS